MTWLPEDNGSNGCTGPLLSPCPLSSSNESRKPSLSRYFSTSFPLTQATYRGSKSKHELGIFFSPWTNLSHVQALLLISAHYSTLFYVSRPSETNCKKFPPSLLEYVELASPLFSYAARKGIMNTRQTSSVLPPPNQTLGETKCLPQPYLKGL